MIHYIAQTVPFDRSPKKSWKQQVRFWYSRRLESQVKLLSHKGKYQNIRLTGFRIEENYEELDSLSDKSLTRKPGNKGNNKDVGQKTTIIIDTTIY